MFDRHKNDDQFGSHPPNGSSSANYLDHSRYYQTPLLGNSNNVNAMHDNFERFPLNSSFQSEESKSSSEELSHKLISNSHEPKVGNNANPNKYLLGAALSLGIAGFAAYCLYYLQRLRSRRQDKN